ncbi:DUF4282 domain-containing protein [Candidatus Bipolaricaulota bacterium]
MFEFLSFKKFFTPMVIQILFWIGIGVCVVEGIGMIASAGRFSSGLGIINGLLVLIVGPIAVRVLCELIIAIFGIHESLKGAREL